MRPSMRRAATSGLAGWLSLFVASAASAAPLMEKDRLPWTIDDVNALMTQRGYSKEKVLELHKLIGQLEVYPDHTNPKDPAGRNNKSIPKVYYGAPHLAASEARSIVGSDSYAKDALSVLEAYDRFADSLNYEAFRFAGTQAEIEGKINQIHQVEQLLDNPNLSPEKRQNLEKVLNAPRQEDT